ncbi:MAG TPA: hypothetical protein VH325_12990 [Bryobacteraceae bacterium]|nr:hypothetical protein [Bryobacteraceae bacterium]
MTGSISRKLYQQFLLLYPEPFRHEFGDEMLAIFEQCRAKQGSWRLFADVVLSAARQQMRYVSAPAPKTGPLYAEITSSPYLARMLAMAAFGAALVAGVLVGGNPKAPTSWTMCRPELLFWFPTGAWGQYCFGATGRTRNSASVLITGVWVGRRPDAPESWRVVRSETRLCSEAMQRIGDARTAP